MDKAMQLIIKNIYTLADSQHIPIKDVEKNAGLSVGYLSRLKRDEEGGNKLPVGTLKKIADILNVALDTLLFTDIATVNVEGVEIIKFLDRLSADTAQGILGWRRVGLPIGIKVKGADVLLQRPFTPRHCLLNYTADGPEDGILGSLASDQKTIYGSKYYDVADCEQVRGVELYVANPFRSDAEVYVAKVHYPTETEGRRDVLECYVHAGDVLNPIRKEYIAEGGDGELQRLYAVIKDCFDRPKLQPKILEIMRTYTDSDGSGPGKGERKLKIPDNMMHEGK